MTVVGESLLSLYKNSYTVILFLQSCLGNWVSIYGIRGKELEWFDEYLNGRKQGLHRRGKEQVD